MSPVAERRWEHVRGKCPTSSAGRGCKTSFLKGQWAVGSALTNDRTSTYEPFPAKTALRLAATGLRELVTRDVITTWPDRLTTDSRLLLLLLLTTLCDEWMKFFRRRLQTVPLCQTRRVQNKEPASAKTLEIKPLYVKPLLLCHALLQFL